jgi:hypothetical protein
MPNVASDGSVLFEVRCDHSPHHSDLSFRFGGYRLGPGVGYYGGGGVSLILLIVSIPLLLRVF